MVKTLELALAKAAGLPEATQEQIARKLLARIEALAGLRAAIGVGLRELDNGEGEELDIEEFLGQIRKENGDG
jgi:hypothetical protein